MLELSEKLNVELSELRVTYYQLKEEHQQQSMGSLENASFNELDLSPPPSPPSLSLSLSLSLTLSLQESSLEWGDVEDALAIIREKKEKGEPLKSLSLKVLKTIKVSNHIARDYMYVRDGQLFN